MATSKRSTSNVVVCNTPLVTAAPWEKDHASAIGIALESAERLCDLIVDKSARDLSITALATTGARVLIRDAMHRADELGRAKA